MSGMAHVLCQATVALLENLLAENSIRTHCRNQRLHHRNRDAYEVVRIATQKAAGSSQIPECHGHVIRKMKQAKLQIDYLHKAVAYIANSDLGWYIACE
jgi:hypothetical protein